MLKDSFFCLFLLVLTPLVCRGDTAVGKRSYVIPLPDVTSVFVMIGSLEDHELSVEEKEKEKLIRNKYRTSGLYKAESQTPLWEIDWYSHAVILSPDGEYLVRQGPWASSSSDEALTFFARDKELRRYKIKDFVDLSWALPNTVSHFRWIANLALEQDGRVLALTTLHGDSYTLDIRTGEILSAWRPLRLIAAGFPLLVAGVVIIALRRRRRTTNAVVAKAHA